LQCCEAPAEERGAGNLHATFCGNRGRVTASGDPVRGGVILCVYSTEKRAPLMPSAPSGTISHVVYARFLGGQMAATLAWDSTSHLRTACPKAITT
jgi:hypothetical protein